LAAWRSVSSEDNKIGAREVKVLLIVSQEQSVLLFLNDGHNVAENGKRKAQTVNLCIYWNEG